MKPAIISIRFELPKTGGVGNPKNWLVIHGKNLKKNDKVAISYGSDKWTGKLKNVRNTSTVGEQVASVQLTGKPTKFPTSDPDLADVSVTITNQETPPETSDPVSMPATIDPP